MSRFHQLSGGKRGKGPGNAPLATGPTPFTAESLQPAASVTNASRTRKPVTSRKSRFLLVDDKRHLRRLPAVGVQKEDIQDARRGHRLSNQEPKSFSISEL